MISKGSEMKLSELMKEIKELIEMHGDIEAEENFSIVFGKKINRFKMRKDEHVSIKSNNEVTLLNVFNPARGNCDIPYPDVLIVEFEG
jgi:effector-binding domain-containing protein